MHTLIIPQQSNTFSIIGVKLIVSTVFAGLITSVVIHHCSDNLAGHNVVPVKQL